MEALFRRIGSSTLGPAVLAAVALWAAFPPMGLWPLAWIAPVPWIVLIRRAALTGRRPYRALWLAGTLFWLGVLWWLCLPYPPLIWIGWLALSIYLGSLFPLWMALCRVAVHRLHWPVIVAAPVMWVGIDYLRAYLLTGFSMGALAHSQVGWIALIQVSDLVGEFGVTFLVMFVAACLGRMLPLEGRRRAVWPLVPAGVAMAIVLAYGAWRTAAPATEPGGRVALIQCSIDTKLDPEPDTPERAMRQGVMLSRRAVRDHGPLDLIVWPETMYVNPIVSSTPDAPVPPDCDWTMEQWQARLKQAPEDQRRVTAMMAAEFNASLLLGLDALHYTAERIDRYNAAALYQPDGKIQGIYRKTHPVMFGEYIPFAQYVPWLHRLTPLAVGLTPGREPNLFTAGRMRLAPSICYESVLSRIVCGHVRRLRDRGEDPNVLVNLTNDGWFWGSSELDMHLTCGVFRAVECRMPMLIAANTGFSASIASDGRILARGPRRAPDVVLADVRLDHRKSLYLVWGDWFAGGCSLACLLAAIVGLWRRKRKAASNT